MFLLQVFDQFVFVVMNPPGVADRDVQRDLLRSAGRQGQAASLQVAAEVIEGAGVTAQEPGVLVLGAPRYGAEGAGRTGRTAGAHASAVDVVVRLVGED